MNNPTETLDAIEQALRFYTTLVPSRDIVADTEPCCGPMDGAEFGNRARNGLTHLATLKQQVADLVAFREAHEHLMVIYRHGQVRGIARRAYETSKPQPVDASSLARIARVALDAKVYIMRASNLEDSGWRNAIPPLTASSDALTPNDIALAQALAGGA